MAGPALSQLDQLDPELELSTLGCSRTPKHKAGLTEKYWATHLLRPALFDGLEEKNSI